MPCERNGHIGWAIGKTQIFEEIFLCVENAQSNPAFTIFCLIWEQSDIFT